MTELYGRVATKFQQQNSMMIQGYFKDRFMVCKDVETSKILPKIQGRFKDFKDRHKIQGFFSRMWQPCIKNSLTKKMEESFTCLLVITKSSSLPFLQGYRDTSSLGVGFFVKKSTCKNVGLSLRSFATFGSYYLKPC